MLKAQITIFLIFSLLVSFLFYANKTSIEISTKVQGEIIPFGNIRKIQNLEGGIIKKIYVKEGAKVKQGDVFLDLEMIISESEVGEINSRLAFLDTEILFLKKIHMVLKFKNLDFIILYIIHIGIIIQQAGRVN